MKRIIALLMALLTLGSLFACTPVEEDETEIGGESTEDTVEETIPETEAETEPEAEPEELRLHRFPMGKEPKIVYFANGDGTREEQVLLSSLQGLACRLTEEHVYLGALSGATAEAMQKMKPDVLHTETLNGERAAVWNLMQHYYEMDAFEGYILCTESNPVSVDIAISLAGLLNGLVVIDTIQSRVEEIGYECILDVSDKDDAWLRSSEYWNQLRRDMSFQASYTVSTCLIDWAVYCGGTYYTNYLGTVIDEEIAKYEFLDDNAIIFGYNHTLGETVFIAGHSANNASLIPTDFMGNLSALRSYAQETMTQPRVEITDEILEPGNVHTVTFIYSDGDNMCFSTGGMISYVNHPRKEDVPISYGVPATSIDLTAPVMYHYYTTKTPAQEFVMSLSGLGYSFPSTWDPEVRATMTEELAEYMRRTDLKYMIMLDGLSWDETVLSDFTEHEGIEGIFYVQGENKNGQVLWTNGKPTVCERLSFTLGRDGAVYPQILRFLTRDTLAVNPEKTRSYSMYYVGAWCTGTDVVASLVDELGDNVDVVTPDVFMQRLIHNCKPTEE